MKFIHKVGAFLIVFLLFTTVAFAQTGSPTTPSPAIKIEYTLPYPGVLPDHPLFTLKLLRDRILDFLIVDPLRKAEFYLLQADKRLGMGVSLIQKGNAELAQKTIAQGETYLSQAVSGLLALKETSREIPGFIVERITNAAAKHEEVLQELVAQAKGKEQEGLKASLVLVQKMIEEIKKLQ